MPPVWNPATTYIRSGNRTSGRLFGGSLGVTSLRTLSLILALVVLLAFPIPTRSATPETRVLDVRWATEGSIGKVFIEFDNPVNYRSAGSPSSIVIDLWPAQLTQWPSLEIAHPLVRHVWVNQIADNVARIRIDLAQPARYKTFLKSDPSQLIVLIIPPWMATTELPASLAYEKLRVATGLVYERLCSSRVSKRSQPARSSRNSQRASTTKSCVWRPRAGYTNAHVLRVDPADPNVEIRPGLAANMITGSEATSLVATHNDALAAVNGGYFAGPGFPLGVVVIDGELVSIPVNRRTAFAITRTGRPIIETFEFQGYVHTSDHVSLWVSSVNQPPAPGGLAIFTRHYGPLIPPHVLAAVVRGDIVESITGGRVMIPDDGYVLTVAGNDTDLILKHIHPGQRLRTDLQLTPNNVDVVSALGGGPRLVKDGKEFIPFAWEWFTPHFYNLRTARTAVGITDAGKVLFVTVDARNGHNTGMSLHELAQLMIRLGAREAMNLDGGGSATMVVGGRLVNDPADGFERPIASALLILRRAGH